MTANSTIIRIGNSNGIIIPAKILKSLSLSEKDMVSITESHGGLLLKKVPSDGVQTPFSALDTWYDEHCPELCDSIEDSLEYIESIRKARKNKEIVQW